MAGRQKAGATRVLINEGGKITKSRKRGGVRFEPSQAQHAAPLQTEELGCGALPSWGEAVLRPYSGRQGLRSDGRGRGDGWCRRQGQRDPQNEIHQYACASEQDR